jgi:hypothetical protein
MGCQKIFFFGRHGKPSLDGIHRRFAGKEKSCRLSNDKIKLTSLYTNTVVTPYLPVKSM